MLITISEIISLSRSFKNNYLSTYSSKRGLLGHFKYPNVEWLVLIQIKLLFCIVPLRVKSPSTSSCQPPFRSKLYMDSS